MGKFIRIGVSAVAAWILVATLAQATPSYYYSFDGPANSATQDPYAGGAPGAASSFTVAPNTSMTLNVYLVENSNGGAASTDGMLYNGADPGKKYGVGQAAFQLYYPNTGGSSSQTYSNFIVQPTVTGTTFTGSPGSPGNPPNPAWGAGTAWTGSNTVSPGSPQGLNTFNATTTGLNFYPSQTGIAVNPYIYGNGTTSAVQIGAGLVTYGNTYGFQNIGTSNYVYNLQTYNAGQANGIKVNGVTSNYAEFLIGSFTFTSNSTLGTVQIGATQYDWSGGEYDQIHFNSTGSAATPDSSEGAMGVATMTITVSSVPEPPSIAALVGMVLTGGVLWVVYRRRSAKLAVAS